MENLIGVQEAHETTQIPYETIYWAARNGRINGARQLTAGKVWVFTLEALNTWRTTDYRPQNRNGKKQRPLP